MKLGSGLSLTNILRSSDVQGAFRGLVQARGLLTGGLTRSLKGSVSATALFAGALSFNKALAGTIMAAGAFAGTLTGGGASMPAGAIGIWYGDDFVTGPRNVIKNTLDATAASVNVVANGVVSPASAFAQNNITLTASNATDWRGTANTAHTAIGTGFWFMRAPRLNIALAAGRYTAGIWVKRAAAVGTDQQFRIRNYTSPSSGTLTATSVWQRFAWTFDWAGGTINLMHLCSFDDSTGASLEWSEAGIYLNTGGTLGVTVSAVGAATDALYDEQLGSHMYLDPAHSVTGGIVDLTAAGLAPSIRLNSAQTLTAFTAIAVRQKINVTSGGAISPIFAKVNNAGNGYADFAPCLQADGGGATGYWNGNNDSAIGFPFYPNNNVNNWYFEAETFDGAQHIWTRNDVDLAFAPRSGGSVSIRDLCVSSYAPNQTIARDKYLAWALYPFALTQTQRKAAYAALASKLTQKSLAFKTVNRLLVVEGHSLTQGRPSAYLLANASPAFQAMVTAGRNSGTLTNNAGNSLTERAAAVKALLPTNGSGRSILTVMIDVNDYSLYTPAQWLTALAAYLDDMRAAGYKIVLESSPDSARTGYRAWSATVEATKATWVGVHCDAYADYRSTAAGTAGTAGAEGTTTTTTYFQDGTHLNAAGYALIDPIYTAAINSIT